MAEKKLDIKIGAPGAKETQSALSKIGESLKGLKRSGGAEGLEQIGNLLRGAGAVGGITSIASSLNAAATEMRKFVIEISKGEATLGDLTEAIAAGIPVYGEVVKAGRSIQGLIRDSLAVGIRNNTFGLGDTDSPLGALLNLFGGADAIESGELRLQQAQDQAKILERLNTKFEDAERRSRLQGLEGTQRQIAEAELDFEKKILELGELRRLVLRLEEPRREAEFTKLNFREEALKGELGDKIREIRSKSSSSSTKMLPPSLDSRFLSGVASQAKDEIELRKIAKNGEETNKKLDRLVKAVERSAGSSSTKLLVAPSFR